MWSPTTSVPRARRELARSVLQVLQRWGYEEQALPPWLDYEELRPALHRFAGEGCKFIGPDGDVRLLLPDATDRKSTRLNSSHVKISYAVFCLKKKKKKQ